MQLSSTRTHQTLIIRFFLFSKVNDDGATTLKHGRLDPLGVVSRRSQADALGSGLNRSGQQIA